MLQFICAPNFWYVYVRRYQQFCTLMADSLRELRTAVCEWECCKSIDIFLISSQKHVVGIHKKRVPTTYVLSRPILRMEISISQAQEIFLIKINSIYICILIITHHK